MLTNWTDFLFIALAALAAGLINALAGGGTLITFPVLTALGLPAVSANVTNTVALLPGYLGGILAQRVDLHTLRSQLLLLIPAGLLGGLVGAALPVGLAAVYGGYFGAGLSVIILAVLGLTQSENLTLLNAPKQAVSFSANLAAAVFFFFSGQVVWQALRWLVVAIGVIAAAIYFVRA